MLTLYHAPLSPCAQKVRLVLHQKQLGYDSVLVDILRKENLQPHYLRINPNGVVPTLVDGGPPILESSIICEYLEDRFPAYPLRPEGAGERAVMRLLAKRVDDKIHPASGVLLFGSFVRRGFLSQTAEQRAAMLARMPDPVRRERQADLLEHGLNSSRIPAAIKVFKDMADDIQMATSRAPWMQGDRLSLADLMLTPYVRVLEILGLDDVFAERPALADWIRRMRQTPGYIGGIAAFETPQDAEQRAPLIPEIAARLAPLFRQAA